MSDSSRKPIPFALALATILILLNGCSPSDREEQAEGQSPGQTEYAAPYGHEGLTQARLDTDPMLLGFTYEDSTLGLRFAPPRGWAPVDEQQFTRVREQLGRFFAASGPFRAHPKRIFLDEGRMIFMILASFESWPSPSDPFQALPDYLAGVTEEMPDMLIQPDLFQSREIAIYQLQMSNDIAVNRRLVLIREGHAPVRVDYIMPRKLYDDLSISVQASIGSFQPLDR